MITEDQLDRSNKLVEKIKELKSIIDGIDSIYVRNRIGLIKYYPESTRKVGDEAHDNNKFFYEEFKDFIKDSNDALKRECKQKIESYEKELGKMIFKED